MFKQKKIDTLILVDYNDPNHQSQTLTLEDNKANWLRDYLNVGVGNLDVDNIEYIYLTISGHASEELSFTNGSSYNSKSYPGIGFWDLSVDTIINLSYTASRGEANLRFAPGTYSTGSIALNLGLGGSDFNDLELAWIDSSGGTFGLNNSVEFGKIEQGVFNKKADFNCVPGAIWVNYYIGQYKFPDMEPSEDNPLSKYDFVIQNSDNNYFTKVEIGIKLKEPIEDPF